MAVKHSTAKHSAGSHASNANAKAHKAHVIKVGAIVTTMRRHGAKGVKIAVTRHH